MNRRCFVSWWPAVLATVVALVPVAASAQGFKWWESEKFKRELQLTTEQISRIEEVFQAALPELRQQKKALDRLEQDLSRLIDTSADEEHVMQQADKVESVRAELSKARTLMLLRMRRVLTADQRVKLGALHEEWERNRKRQDRRR